MTETPVIMARRHQSDTWLEWLFDWLGTRWEAEAFNVIFYVDGTTRHEPVLRTHSYSNTRRGAIRKAKRRLYNKQHPIEWEDE